MATREEQALLALAQAEKQRNNPSQRPLRVPIANVPRAPSARSLSHLPELTPEMFMNEAQLREMRAAMPFAGPQAPVAQVPPPQAQTAPADHLRGRPRQAPTDRLRGVPQDVIMFDDASDWAVDLDSVEAAVTTPSIDLESIFMDRAMAEMGGEPPPVHEASYERPQRSARLSRSEAVAVSQRSAEGRWQTHQRPSPPTVASAPVPPTRAPASRPQPPGPTVYEHMLMDNDD